ncbi:MAG: nucleoside triphosphate pyrophosphohydrolase [Desulfitobacteriaceae bacterium]|nr:nucleoside triphosphate pyrophosphohydrolase [Desulfitobacteriaceae bacterium]MDD4752089.1 nucleoside triphosphate pyrophosphohydrolase [Desulfitobacteriaceae bacterium]
MTGKGKYPLDDLVEVMATLRGNGGCPWDREQNHDSIKKYLVEETYEVIETIDEKNMHKLCEELGDLLLQIVFHAQMASEKGVFNVNDVIKGVVEKMIRRHPHVFAEGHAENSEQVLEKWEEIKAEEHDRPKRLLDVPLGLPALHRAQKIQEKAARVGFDWPNIEGAWEKITEEMAELQESINIGKGEKEELGDLLFAVVNVARFLHVDAEEAMRETVDKFTKRFSYIEDYAKAADRDLKELSLNEMDQLWNEAKINLF